MSDEIIEDTTIKKSFLVFLIVILILNLFLTYFVLNPKTFIIFPYFAFNFIINLNLIFLMILNYF